jgi:hypothetical protein
MVSYSMIYLPSFMKIGTDSSNIKVLPQQFERLNVGITFGRPVMYSVEMGLGVTIYIPSSMTIGSAITVISQQFERI